MGWEVLFIGFVILLFVLLVMGQWIAFGLGTVGLVGLIISGENFNALGSIAFNSINSFELVSIPLFILMGEIIMIGGISSRFYNGISIWTRFIPGGLLHANILASGFFAAVSGSSNATTATVASVAIPELNKRKYNIKMTLGSISAGGGLGILIPPSIPLIVYGAMVEESIAKLFIAGVIPGLSLLVLFMIYIFIRSIFQKDLAPRIAEKSSWTTKLKSLYDILPILILIVIIFGGIYLGFATPTESAALSCIIAVILSLILKEFKWEDFKVAVLKTVKTTCMILIIVVGAQVFSYMLVMSGISRSLVNAVVEFNLPPLQFILVCIIIYLILGCLVDGLSMIFLTLPLLYPIIVSYGFDSIWFGILLVILIEIAQLTPPMGLNLFIMNGISGRPIGEIVVAAIPYLIIMLAFIGLLIVYPDIALWLPNQMSNH